METARYVSLHLIAPHVHPNLTISTQVELGVLEFATPEKSIIFVCTVEATKHIPKNTDLTYPYVENKKKRTRTNNDGNQENQEKRKNQEKEKQEKADKEKQEKVHPKYTHPKYTSCTP